MVVNIESADNNGIALGDLMTKLLASLESAHSDSLKLIDERGRQKLTIMRISNISREIRDLMKIVKTIKES